MTARPGLRLLALVVPVLLLAPVAAHAEKVVTEDAVGDVVALGETEQGGGDLDNLVPAPENLTADVVRTVVDHRASRLRVRIDLRELGSHRTYFAGLRVRTPSGSFDVEVDNLVRRPKAELTRGSRAVAVECARLRATTDEARARAVVTIPSACLGGPRWVQVGVGAASLVRATDADGTEDFVVHGDDAHRVGDIRNRLTLGPKVRRG